MRLNNRILTRSERAMTQGWHDFERGADCDRFRRGGFRKGDVRAEDCGGAPDLEFSFVYVRKRRRIRISGKRRAKADIREPFDTAVESRRDHLGMTQDQLAGATGIDRTCLSDVERGARNPSLVILGKLAPALSISLSDLFASVDKV